MPTRFLLPPTSPSKDPSDYPYFQGSISRWLWRIYIQRLTPAGRWFALATAVFVTYGGASLQLQGYVLAAYAGALWLVALIAVVLYRPRVKLDVRLSPRICAGETLPVDVTITQTGGLRGADLIVLPHHLPSEIDTTPELGLPLPDLSPGESTRARVSLLCHKRGSYTLHGFRVESAFPFAILRTRRTFREDRQLLVYPRFSALSRLALPTGRRYQPGGVALASELGESFEYLGNREYREGDNVRDIDWRATARVSRPIVREWVEEYMLRVAVILDTHVPKKGFMQGFRGEGSGFSAMRKALNPRSLLSFLNPVPRTLNPHADAFERAVSLAASVSDYMARQDYLVDIFAAGPNLYHLTAGRSLAYLDQILDILACVEENPHEPFETIEPQIGEILSRISTVICVLLDWNETRRNFVEHLLQQGAAVKVIIVRDEPCTIDPASAPDAVSPVAIITRAQLEKGVAEL